MKKIEKLMLKEEDQILKETLAICLAKLIGLHYKYYKNKKFDTFDQYCDSYTCFTILSEKEKVELYHTVDKIMEQEYNLFFAHYELGKPIYLVDVSGKDDFVC